MHDIENMDGIPPAMSELPGWPKVIGTISIVWASLGLLCGGCGMIFLVAMPTFMKGAVEKLGPMPPPMLPSPEQMVLGGIGFLWAIVLLVAGITTVTRRPIGRPLHLIHGAVAIILGVLAIFFTTGSAAGRSSLLLGGSECRLRLG